MLPAGPKIKGNLAFDDYCFYGNNMILTKDQMNFLSYWCAEGEPDAKYFLYKMTHLAVIEKKCKLVSKLASSSKKIHKYLCCTVQ